MILCANPRAQYLAYKDEINAAIARVLHGERYILGQEVAAFEDAFAAFAQIAHTVGVGNGTDALVLALSALGVGPGDEVITVSHTASATVSAICQTGAVPVMIDVDALSYTMDSSKLETAISAKTKAIIAVHIYGHPADMQAICSIAEANSLPVIEDCAQAHGAMLDGRSVGSFGQAATYSFYPTKNLGAIGDGGMITTQDDKLAAKIRSLREYGWDAARNSQHPGYNSRLDELQAAILRVKLTHLDDAITKRRDIAGRYDEALKKTGLLLPSTKSGALHAYHLYVVRHQRRDALLAHLKQADIHAGIHYPLAAHQQTAYANNMSTPGGMSVTESLCGEILSLPMYPELSEPEVSHVIESVLAFNDT